MAISEDKSQSRANNRSPTQVSGDQKKIYGAFYQPIRFRNIVEQKINELPTMNKIGTLAILLKY